MHSRLGASFFERVSADQTDIPRFAQIAIEAVLKSLQLDYKRFVNHRDSRGPRIKGKFRLCYPCVLLLKCIRLPQVSKIESNKTIVRAKLLDSCWHNVLHLCLSAVAENETSRKE